MKFDVTYEVKELDNFIGDLKKLDRAAKRAGQKMTLDAARHFAKMIREEYQRGTGNRGPSQYSLLQRRQGKLAGKWQAQSPSRSTVNYRRFKNLSRHVEVSKVKKSGNVITHTVGIRDSPTTRTDNKTNAADAARIIEFGATWTMTTTIRHLTYLRALILRKAGVGAHIRPPHGVRTLLIKIPPRPVWSKTISAFEPIYNSEYQPMFFQYLAGDVSASARSKLMRDLIKAGK